MRNALRMFLVGLMIVALTVNPAVACHFCGGFFHGGWGWGGCGGCGDDCCGGDCGGCGDCGSCGGCDSGGGCDSCGGVVADEGVVVEHGVESMPTEVAPSAPVETPAGVTPTQPTTPPQTPTLPPESDAPPALPPETPAESGELFDSQPPAETPPAETDPATEPAAPAESPATPPAEELFNEPAAGTEAAPESAPAETPAAPAEGEKADEAELFGSARDVLREAGGLDSNEMRQWVDNTGKYSVNARLIRFVDGHVRLMKDTGRTTTVPLRRLSERDLEFVNRQASAQKVATTQTAQVEAPAVGIAN